MPEMRLIRRIFLLAGGLCHLASAEVVPAPAPITHLADIRQMQREVAGTSLPVSVTGVVTWCSPGRLSGGFMIDQDGAGIFVIGDGELPDGRKGPGAETIRSLAVGDKLEVVGVTRAGRYAPSILAAEIRVVGRAAVPEGKELGLGFLLTGNFDAQRVALKGVITGCRPSDYGDGSWVMVLAGASGKARAVVPAMPGMRPEDMEDARVLISGVVFTRCNSRQELVGISIETSRVEDVQIYRPGGRDPFGVQLLEAGRLRAFVPGGYSQHRRRIEGVVTLSKPGVLYLQGPKGGTRISTRTQEQVHTPGDVVEAAGFVEIYQGASELAGSITRRKSAGKPVQPVDLSIPVTADLGEFDGMLVRTLGVVLECHESPEGIEMLLSDSGRSFHAMLLKPLPAAPMLIPGSEVSLTGVAEMAYELGPYFPDRNTVSSMRILLRGPDDIVIHRVPPWWNTRRLLIALGLSAGLAALLAGAAVFLMRRVRAQSNQLATEALAHRQVTAAHGAMMEERSRLAGEMHDGLQPMLSGLSFYLDAADSKLNDSRMEGVGEALERSRTLLSRIREEFRQCIWCLYELGRQTGDLDNELRRLARIQRQWSHAEVNTEIAGEPFPLPASISRGLLLACQEAVENASRHGKAERIEIHCEFSERGVEIAVEDDGCGFDVSSASDAPGAHFGLSGMRQRIERLGGVLDVVSEPATGTRLTMSLSRECIVRVEANPLVISSILPETGKTPS
jgi:signal transduction histidine kinase